MKSKFAQNTHLVDIGVDCDHQIGIGDKSVQISGGDPIVIVFRRRLLLLRCDRIGRTQDLEQIAKRTFD